MSTATMSARAHDLIPADELIGSLTRERVELMARYAAGMTVEQGSLPPKRWLSYAMDADIPNKEWDQLYRAATTHHLACEGDLEYWFDIENTPEQRELLMASTGSALDFTISTCAQHISTDLGL